jgi:Fe-S-cluster containining protein
VGVYAIVTPEERAELFALYAEAERELEAFSCDCPARGSTCCHFDATGREPYPTAVELAELERAIRGSSPRRPLPVAGACPLLSTDGRCSVYSSRPFGCRTFFCDQKLPRQELQRVARAILALSERYARRRGLKDPGPRPLTRALPLLTGRRK